VEQILNSQVLTQKSLIHNHITQHCLPHQSCVVLLRFQFLADRTNGRAHVTVLCPPVVCKICIVAKRGVLPKKKLSEEEQEMAYEKSNSHVTENS